SSRKQSTLAPVADFKKLENIPREEIVRNSPALGVSPFLPSDPVPSLTGVKDEYNPLRPNDYEELMKKRKEKSRDRDEDDKRRDDRDPGRESVGELERARRRREDDEDSYERPVRNTQFSDDGAIGGMASTGGLSVASKIMARYGYKEGQGLGKSEQGMSTALFVEKTSKRGGKIIHERDLPKDTPREVQTNANVLRNPTKVVLLRMPDTTEDESVRIFVEFDRIDSAIKAIIDLNGRYFGGRVVRACFYNLDKFRRLDLGADVENPP
ncbi:SPF45-like protein, partial [Mya arenaria]